MKTERYVYTLEHVRRLIEEHIRTHLSLGNLGEDYQVFSITQTDDDHRECRYVVEIVR